MRRPLCVSRRGCGPQALVLSLEATEKQVRVVVEAIEELELVEAEQHLYIHIHMQQGKASESSE
jgi:hypothetical protein